MSSLWNPKLEELFAMLSAVEGAQITNMGCWNVDTRVVDPSEVVQHGPNFVELCDSVEESLSEPLVIDGTICPSPGNSLHVRLEVPAEYPHLAIGFKKATFVGQRKRSDFLQDPDITVYCNPDTKVGLVKHVERGGFTRIKGNRAVIVGDESAYVVGSDLLEDVLTGLLKVAAKNIASRRGILLPGGIKQVTTTASAGGHDRRFIMFGDEGAGVTRTTFGGERSGLQQDGFVQLMSLAIPYPVLNASNAGTYQTSTSCSSLHNAIMTGNCIMENVDVVDGYADPASSSHGRALIEHADVEGHIRLDDERGTDTFVILVDDDGITPAVAKLTPSQFSSMVLSNMKEWGLTSTEANNLHHIIVTNALKSTEFYVINTGEVAQGKSVVTEKAVQTILLAIARGGISWKLDRALGWEICSHQIQDCDTYILNPVGGYSHDARFNEYLALQQIHVDRTREYLRSTYPGLTEDVYEDIASPVPSTELEKLHAEAVSRGEKVFQHPVTGEPISTELAHWSRGYCCGDDPTCDFCPYN